jgi:hypothetical protein
MSQYRAPLTEMLFVMNDVAGLADVSSLPGFEDASPDTVAAILEEAGKFASGVLDPLNVVGDREGARPARRRRRRHASRIQGCVSPVLRARLERARQGS